jgi:DNA-binding Xre family transcriptional regulator
MKQRIITQITKTLNITEDYLAGYLGISPNTLNVIKNTKGWSSNGKDLRLYRLNQIINILRNNKSIKKGDIKNILDNERFLFNNHDEDYSYITIINALSNMTEFVNFLVLNVKISYIQKNIDISKSMLSGLLDCTESNLEINQNKVDRLYLFVKKVLKKKKVFHLSILNEPFVEIENNTPLYYILEDTGYFSKLEPRIEQIIEAFYKED